MQAWAVLLLLSAGTPSNTTTLDQIVGEYEGLKPSIDTAIPWKLSIRSDGTFRSELKLPRIHAFEGDVKLEADRVTLEWTTNLELESSAMDAPVEAGPTKLSEKFLPVRWGKRLYLIEDFQKEWFIRDVIRGGEPRHSGEGVHLLRVGDWKLRVSGRPEVPEDWKKKFPPDNFRTRVKRQIAYHRGEVDAGSNSGLAAGMLLTLYSSKYGATDLRVVSVTAGTAVVENDYGDPPLTKGTRVYSRVPTARPRGQ